jgi:hypothetical protein
MGMDPSAMQGGPPGGAPGGGGPPPGGGGAPGGAPDPMALMALAKLARRKHSTKGKHKGKKRK